MVLGLAAVYGCVRFISDAVASLPLRVYRNSPDGTPIRLPRSALLDDPSIAANVYDWLFMATSSMLLWGNAYGLITSRIGVNSPDGYGYPRTIEWLPPDRMAVRDDEEQPWNPLRAQYYLDGRRLERHELVHLRAFVIPGRTEAISPMRAFATLISQGMDALSYSASWFENGGFPLGTFQNIEDEVDVQSAKEIRQNLMDTLRAHQPLVYGRNWDYKPVVVPPNEAVFMQAMQLNATQVAAIYGMPPEKVGGASGNSFHYSSSEQDSLDILVNTLRPWLTRWETALSAMLPKPQYARFDVDALLKTDLKTRYEIQQIQRTIGVRTTDELRRNDELAPFPGEAGNDAIPLGVMERMAATTRALPKGVMSQVVIEQDRIVELLEKLQAKQMAPMPQPGKPPVKMTPEQYLGNQITAIRSDGQGETRHTIGEPGHEHIGGWAGPPSGEHETVHPPMAELMGAAEDTHRVFVPHHIRASNAERERAVAWIEAAGHVGCLQEEEVIRRRGQAQGALKRGMLAELTSDLPGEAELAAGAAGGEAVQGESAQQKVMQGAAALSQLYTREFDPGGAHSLNGHRHPNGR